ncbi:MAG: hypothetical protein WA190_09935 [Usitatibacter sp.]
MNTRKTFLIASALVAAASTLSSQAADNSFSVEQQMAEGDGYYSQYPDRSPQKPVKPETARELQRDQEVLRQMSVTDGFYPLFTVTRGPVAPETALQLQRDKVFARQMAEGDGYILMDTVHPAANRAVATAAVAGDAGE